jgi:hypothetical protein
MFAFILVIVAIVLVMCIPVEVDTSGLNIGCVQPRGSHGPDKSSGRVVVTKVITYVEGGNGSDSRANHASYTHRGC